MENSKKSSIWHAKSDFRSLFLSYFLLCVIALLIAGGGYIQNYRTLMRTTENYGAQQAYTITEQIDSRLMITIKSLDILSSKTILTEFGKYTDQEISVNISRTLVLKDEFSARLTTDI